MTIAINHILLVDFAGQGSPNTVAANTRRNEELEVRSHDTGTYNLGMLVNTWRRKRCCTLAKP